MHEIQGTVAYSTTTAAKVLCIRGRYGDGVVATTEASRANSSEVAAALAPWCFVPKFYFALSSKQLAEIALHFRFASTIHLACHHIF
jgi:hypothetical protein